MRYKAILLGFLLLAGLLLPGICRGQELDRNDPTVRSWYEALSSAKAQVRQSVKTGGTDPAKSQASKMSALQKFDEALAVAPNAECGADTLLHLAEAYEAFPDRAKAIETYRRLVDSYPASGHVPYAYQRLGDFHASVTLMPTNASEEEVQDVQNQMSPYKAIDYFEKAVAAGSPTSLPVLTSKAALIIRYKDVGRKDDGWKLLDDYANLKIEDVKEGDYIGPWREIHDGPGTMSERIDSARRWVARCRQATPELMIRQSREVDPAKTVENLQKLVTRYPDTDIAQAAVNEIARVKSQASAPADAATR